MTLMTALEYKSDALLVFVSQMPLQMPPIANANPIDGVLADPLSADCV